MYQKNNKNYSDAIAGPNRIFDVRFLYNNEVLVNSVKSFTITSGSEEITIGSAISSYVQATIEDKNVLLSGKEASLEIGLEIDGEAVYIPMGVYTIQNPKKESNKITFTAYDRLTSKCNNAYFSELTYPCDALDVLTEIEAKTGITINKDNLQSGIKIDKRAILNDDCNEEAGEDTVITTYANPFDGYTFKEAIGFIAGLFGKIAICDRTGTVQFSWYKDIAYDISSDIFYNDLQETEESFSVERLICDNYDQTISSGSGSTGISMQNPCMTQDILDEIHNDVKDLTYTPATLRFIGDPRLDIGDIITIVKNDETKLIIPVISLITSYDGGLMQTIASYGNTVEEDDSDTKGPITEMAERVEYELATVKNLMSENISATNATIKNLSGDVLNFKTGEFENLKSDVASFKKTTTDSLNATNAKIRSLDANTVKTADLEAKVGTFGYIKAKDADITYATIKNLTATNAKITALESNTVKTKDLEAEVGKFGYLKANELESNVAKFGYLKADEAEIKYATITDLSASNAKIESLEADTIKTKDLEAKVGTFGYLKADNAKLTYATIKNLDASNAKITTLESDQATFKKATAENLNATNAKITNIEADYVKASEIEAKVGTYGYLKANELESKVATFGYLKANDATLTYATIENLNATNAKIKTIESDYLKTENADITYATIKNLNSTTARIKTIESDYVKSSVLESDVAKFGYLKADDATLTYATITNLNTAVGRVDTLESNYSDINTLVNGNLTSKNIQSLTLTSKNTTIENGMIKNAMIENLAFDKITGIDINTTNLTVHSSDGKSKWADNTIQISDANRVRVQIGKDASNDYSMSVWDKNGNLIWDALGATDKTIQRKIIRDDVVADNANISGSKLDINSVIKEVNGSTTKLKSSVINMDDKNQTLDVAFNEMETTVANNLSSAKVYADGKMSDAQKYALEQANSALSNAKSYTNSAVDGIQVGGRNLLLKSKELNNTYYVNDYPKSGEIFKGYQVRKSSGAWNGIRPRFNETVTKRNVVKAGDILTYSIYAKTDDTAKIIIAMFNRRVDNSTGCADIRGSQSGFELTNDWKLYSVTFIVTESMLSDDKGITFFGYETCQSTTSGKYVYWACPELEYGNKVTDYTPAPEDTDNQIDNITEITTSHTTSINTMQGQISSLISEDTTIKGNYDALVSKYNSTVQTVNSMQTTISEHTTVLNSQNDSIKAVTTKANTIESNLTGTKQTVSNIQSDLTGTKNRVTTVETSLTGLTTRVSNTETNFANLEIGGRNLYYLKDFKEYDKNCVSAYSISNDGEIVLTASGSDMYIGNIAYSQGSTLRSSQGPSIDVEGFSYVTFSVSNSLFNKNYCSWYTKDKKSIGTYQTVGKTASSLEVPENAKYFTLRIGYGNAVVGETYKLKIKVEKGNKATDWTPAPEDTDTQINSVETIATQNANKFSWLVKSGTSSSNFELTDRTATLVAEKINLNGLVTFSGLDSSARDKINTVTSGNLITVTSANPRSDYEKQPYLVVADNKGGKCVQWRSNCGAFLLLNSYTPINFTSSDRLYYDITVPNWSSTTFNTDLTIWFYNKNKTNTISTHVTLTLRPTTWNHFTGYLTLPTSANWGDSYYYIIGLTNPNKQQIGITNDSYIERVNSYATAYTKSAVEWVSTNGKNAESAATWVTQNGTKTNNLYTMVSKWTNGAISDTTQINGGWIKTNTITASKIAIGDFTNYCDLSTNSTYYFETESDAGGTWFWRDGSNFQRDNNISERHSCEPGQSFYVEYDISNTIKEGNEYKYAGIMIFGWDGAGTIQCYLRNAGVTATSEGAVTHVSTIMTVPASVVSFQVYLQIEGHTPFTGKLKIRNISVRKAVTGKLIVDGSISADKISVSSLFAQNIVGTGTISSSKYEINSSGAVTTGSRWDLSTGAFSSPNLKWDANGNITAKGGYIGKYKITDQWLTTGSGSTCTGIGGNQAFWAGSESSNSAPFRVGYDGKLYATDATISGNVTADYLRFNSAGNQQAYFKIATIKISSSYVNLDLVFGANQRNYGYTECRILFNNAGSTDPTLKTFKKTGSGEWAIYKSATSTWDLYLKKAEYYDWGRINRYQNLTSGITVTWSGASADLPSGAISANQMIADQTTIDGGIITTGLINSDRINTSTLFAKEIVASGSIQSENYQVANNAVTAGSKWNLSDGSFSSKYLNWDATGKLTATSGTIAGWTIIADKIYNGATNNYAGIGKQNSAYAFWAGASSPDNSSSAPFRVGHDGSLRATNADITGKITATSGTFTGVTVTGNLTATGGRIGKFNIAGDNNYMMAGSGATAVGMGGNQAFWAGGEKSDSAPFRVSYTGTLVASGATLTDADVSCKITASNGEIAGWKLTTNGLYNNNTTEFDITQHNAKQLYNTTVQDNIFLGKNKLSTIHKEVEDKFCTINGTSISSKGVEIFSSVYDGGSTSNPSNSDTYSLVLTGNKVTFCQYDYDGQPLAESNNTYIRPDYARFYGDVFVEGGFGTDGNIAEGGQKLSAKYAAKSHNHWDLIGGSYRVGVGSSTARFCTYNTSDNNAANNKLSLGASNALWTRVYAANASISTSDKRLKKDIKLQDERYETLFDNLQPVTYRWKNAGSEQGHDRVHTGFISQQVKSAMDQANLTATDFAAFCYDDFTKDPEWNIDSTDGMSDRYSLAYEEFISLNTHMIQKTRKDMLYQAGRIDLQEAIINDLQFKIVKMEKKIEQLTKALA